MKAQGTLEPPRGQRSPLGQKTSGFVLTCFLIQSAEQGKQNLWWGAVGHCTKCVSSRRCAQIVHFRSGLFGIASASERLFMLDLFFYCCDDEKRCGKGNATQEKHEGVVGCNWVPGVGTLSPFFPISLDEVTWLRVGVPTSPGCEAAHIFVTFGDSGQRAHWGDKITFDTQLWRWYLHWVFALSMWKYLPKVKVFDI